MPHGDPVRLEDVRVANARKLEELGRVHRSGRKDNLGSRAHLMLRTTGKVADTCRPPVVENEIGDESTSDNTQVLPAAGRLQECLGRRPADPVALVDLKEPRALVVAIVEVLAARDADFFSGIAEGFKNVPS